MRTYLLLSIFVLPLIFAFVSTSYAACGGGPNVFTCDTNPPNPDPVGIQQEANNNDLTVNALPGSSIDTVTGAGGDCIITGDGNDLIELNGSFLTCDLDGIDANGGNNTINVIDSTIENDFVGQEAINATGGDGVMHVINILRSTVQGDDAVNIFSGSTTIDITDSTLRGDAEAMCLNSNPRGDVVNVLRSEITCVAGGSINCNAIDSLGGPDQITVTESTLRGLPTSASINLGSGDDTLTLNNGANMEGIIDCNIGFDTLIFAMDVPEELLVFISGQLALADPQGDSITINGLLYEWEECELLVNELNGVQRTRPIPTLSEWGLIAMAGVLGISSILVLGRRKFTTS